VKIGAVVLLFGLLTSAVTSFAETPPERSGVAEITSAVSERNLTADPSILARNDRIWTSDPSASNAEFQSPLKPFREEVERNSGSFTGSCGMKPSRVRFDCRVGDCVCDKRGRNCEWQVICN
jgi:hypothetical protein